MDNCLCPSCGTSLVDNNNIVVTKKSEIFKGNNEYVMCKGCGLVMIHNKDRDLFFNLDRYQHDDEVIKEVYNLLKEVDPRLTVAGAEIEKLNEPVEEKEAEPIEEDEPMCTGDCSSCGGCCGGHKFEMPEDAILLMDKRNPQHILIVSEGELNEVDDLESYTPYALSPVKIEAVVTYRIQRP